MNTQKRLNEVVKDNKKTVTLMTIWTLISYFANALHLLCWSMLLIFIINNAGNDLKLLAVAGVLLSILLIKACDYLVVKKKAAYCNAFNNKFREKLFQKLFRLGPAFIEKKRTGEIISTLWEKVEWIGYYLYYYVPVSCSIFVFSLALSLAVLSKQILISVIVLCGGVIIIMLPSIFRRMLKSTGEQEWQDNDMFYSTCLDGLQGIATLKALNANEAHRNKVEQLSEKNRVSVMANLRRTTLNTRVTEFLVSIVELTVDLIGVWAAATGKITYFQLLIIYMLIQSWTDGARRLFGAWLRGNKGMAAFRYADEIMRQEFPYSLTELNTKLSSESLDISKEIRFEDVSFFYSIENRPAVKNINLRIEKGSQVAIVGSSGSGKSTLLHLLFGFYKPQSGTIRFDEVPIERDNVQSIQRMTTVIWQDCRIFHMSCYDNIRIARPDATDQEIYDAARKANIHDKISSLPNGYDTIIGDGGMTFSGGEKQRIAIARAFLRNTPILILDEATSSLDRKNEQEIQECIRQLSFGKTVISVSHRLDTIRNADQIYVLEAGQIVEHGTHDQLLQRGVRYKELMGLSV